MDDILNRIGTVAGIDTSLAAKAVGFILSFLKKEGPQDAVAAILAQMPEAETLMAQAQDGAGMMSGLMGSMGGGIMALGGQLMGAGLSMGQAQSVGKELFVIAKEKAGDETVGKIVAQIPGLSQFI